jgi:hypothetical protein
MHFLDCISRTATGPEPDKRVMVAVMLHGDDAALDMALKSVAQCAMVHTRLEPGL